MSSFKEAADLCGLHVREDNVEAMWRHFTLLLAANQQVNLTRITDPAEAAAKHYVDSLVVTRWATKQDMSGISVLDVGTGGGFPAIPLAIERPDWNIVGVDGTGKKVRCVDQFIRELGLMNCTVLHQHTDHWQQDIPAFDVILCRGIGAIASLLRKFRRLCHKGAVVVFYKSDPLDHTEEAQANQRCARLGFEALPPYLYYLPTGERFHKRQLCAYRKL